MSIKYKKQLIIAALNALGVGFKKLRIPANEDTMGSVYVDEKYFGTFNYIKRTFVD